MVSAHLSAQPTEIKLRGCAPLAEGPQVPARVDRAWVQEVELWREDFRSSLFFITCCHPSSPRGHQARTKRPYVVTLGVGSPGFFSGHHLVLARTVLEIPEARLFKNGPCQQQECLSGASPVG